MKEEKILTKHPLGKSGKNIDEQKYEMLKRAILSALRSRELTHTELFKRLNNSLNEKFSGNINWYHARADRPPHDAPRDGGEKPLSSTWKLED
jgi:hypothetical protein